MILISTISTPWSAFWFAHISPIRRLQILEAEIHRDSWNASFDHSKWAATRRWLTCGFSPSIVCWSDGYPEGSNATLASRTAIKVRSIINHRLVQTLSGKWRLGISNGGLKWWSQMVISNGNSRHTGNDQRPIRSPNRRPKLVDVAALANHCRASFQATISTWRPLESRCEVAWKRSLYQPLAALEIAETS